MKYKRTSNIQRHPTHLLREIQISPTVASHYQLGRNANLKTPFAGETIWEEVPLHRGQFSNGYQNSICNYALTKQFHFWKCSLDIGLHMLRATDLKAKQSHLFFKKKKNVWPNKLERHEKTRRLSHLPARFIVHHSPCSRPLEVVV